MPTFSRLKSIAKSTLTDLRYGQILSGSVPSRFAHLGANFTANTRYDELEEIFTGRIQSDDILVDIGCGKGRVINYWLQKCPNQKLYGLELDPDIAAATKVRLSKFQNVHVIAGDAIANAPADGTLFFLFNPFTEKPMEMFRERMKTLFYSNETRSWKCPIRIFYLNPVHESVFRNDPDFIVEDIRITSSPHRFILITTKP